MEKSGGFLLGPGSGWNPAGGAGTRSPLAEGVSQEVRSKDFGERGRQGKGERKGGRRKETEERRQKKGGFHKGKLLILSVINHA